VKLFAGLSTTDYQDILRAVGLYVDEMGFHAIRILEVDDGIVIQGLPSRDADRPGTTFETLLLTDDDLREILVQAYQRRERDKRQTTAEG